MKIVENYKTFLWSMQMRKIARKLKRRRQMIGLDLAKNVGIYFYYDGKASFEIANRFANDLRNRGISAMLLAYADLKENRQKCRKARISGYL
jgi:3-deoxy-D-manno-octulosonic acid (KDO) 8-phosphate synthase